jgi:hypothetical protein
MQPGRREEQAMSGVDGVAASSPFTPPLLPDALPGPEARVEEHETPADLALDIAIHLGAEAIAAGAEAAGAAGLAGLGVAAGAALGAGVSTVGWLFALQHMGSAVASSLVDGHREGLVAAALGGGGSPESRAFGAGIAASMLDASSPELGAMRDALPRHLRDDFRRGVEHAHAASSDTPEAWMEARGEYRALFRDTTDGAAAAIGGWDDPSRSETFRASRERTEASLEADAGAASELRACYRAEVREGFLDAESGRVDTRRETMDASYRAGVNHRRGLSGEALEQARQSIVGTSAASLLLGHVPIGG